jgi:putative ATP-dependent endonuclease of the OLD family
MKITRIIIRNWRSVTDADFEPADMTILVGANNAGKSNILSAGDMGVSLAGARC